MYQFSERRLAENELMFQSANKQLQEKASSESNIVRFYCECSNFDCRERIPITVKEYSDTVRDYKEFTRLTPTEFSQKESSAPERAFGNAET